MVKDIEHSISVVALQAYLKTEESNLITLWGMMIDKIEGRAKADGQIPSAWPPKMESVIVKITEEIKPNEKRKKSNKQ